jgi:hypothetical protein
MDCLTGALFMPSFEGATRFKIVNISLNEITEPQKALGLQNVESFQYEYLRELFHYDGAVNWQPSTGYIATLGAKIRDMIRKTICTKSTLSVDLPGFVMVDLVPMLQKEGYVVVYPFLNSFAGLGQIHRTTLVN